VNDLFISLFQESISQNYHELFKFTNPQSATLSGRNGTDFPFPVIIRYSIPLNQVIYHKKHPHNSNNLNIIQKILMMSRENFLDTGYFLDAGYRIHDTG